jgi:putative ABC transport system permease protein
MKRIVKHYFRNLLSNRVSSLITILGFSISIAVVIVLVFFIIQEKSYDADYKNINSIYMVVTTKNESYVEEDAKEILINKYPQIALACRYYNWQTNFVYNHDFIEGQVITTDEGFFDIFSTEFKYGNKKTAFSNINGIVLTESYSKKMFHDVYPIGQTIETVGGKIFQVTGIVKDLPFNSSVSGDCFIYYKSKIHRSGINNVSTNGLFVVLQPNTNITDFEKEISKTLIENSKILNNNNIIYGETIEWRLRPFKTAYFDTEIEKDQLQHANIKMIQIVSVISIIVLILAIINFINLNTAESISRIKEIGVRKINGASKRNILFQFLFESLTTCILASILAFLFTQLIIPVFDKILDKQVTFIEFTYLNILFILTSIFLLGIVSGITPAFIASKYSPILLFHSQDKLIFKSPIFRNTLITFQFTISLIMIISLIAILKQLHYAQNKDIGFDASCLVCVDYPDDINKSAVVKKYLLENPNIQNITFSDGSPMAIGNHSGSNDPIESINIMSSDDYFIETFKMKLLLGRNFYYPSEVKECIITENAYKESGWDNLDSRTFLDHKVVGVVNSFNSDDLHLQASNIMITNSSEKYSSVNIRINPNNISESLDYIKKTWDTFFPDFGFRYSFYDEWKEKSFIKETNHARIALVFGILSIILSCLGLYGLVNYSLKHRIKEIGIRKISGARVRDIFKIINVEFLKLILIAFVIACPIAVYVMDKWLNNFAYKTKLNLWIFILSGVIVTVFALLTISWKSYVASNRNPIEALKYE